MALFFSDNQIYLTLKNLSVDNECKCQTLSLYPYTSPALPPVYNIQSFSRAKLHVCGNSHMYTNLRMCDRRGVYSPSTSKFLNQTLTYCNSSTFSILQESACTFCIEYGFSCVRQKACVVGFVCVPTYACATNEKDCIAQWVEHWSRDPGSLGSIPSWRPWSCIFCNWPRLGLKMDMTYHSDTRIYLTLKNL